MIPLRDRLPTRRVPIVNYLILATNVLVFVWEQLTISSTVTARELLLAGGLVPARLVAAPLDYAPSVLTSMFMHDPTGFAHIGGNLLFLWIFGDNVEDAMGRFRYLAFYLLAGIAAAAAQVLIDPGSRIPMVGASGAIAGVLAAYGSLYPRSPITVLNPFIPLWLFFGIFIQLPAWVVILEFFVVNLLNGLAGLGSMKGPGVAFFAHLGGFVAGLVLVRMFIREEPERGYERWHGYEPSRRLPSRRGR